MNIKANDKKLENSKVISARIKGKNLALFNELNISPTDLINYALKKYSEEKISPKRLEIISQIQSTVVNIQNYELKLSNEKSLLKKLQKELSLLEQQEYAYKSETMINKMHQRYCVEIHKGTVDCVESFFNHCNDFILFESYKLKVTDEELSQIKNEFYIQESNAIEVDDVLSRDNVIYEDLSH